MKLEGKRVAVLVENFYEDLELWYPVLRFREEGARVSIVGPRAEKFTSKNGYPAQADLAIDQASAKDFDAVIIPGGYAPDQMRRTPAMVEFVRRADEAGAVIGAICHGGWMLASAGIVRGRRLTCFFSIKDDLVNAGARYEDREAVRDAIERVGLAPLASLLEPVDGVHAIGSPVIQLVGAEPCLRDAATDLVRLGPTSGNDPRDMAGRRVL